MAKKFQSLAAIIYVTDSEEAGVMEMFSWKPHYFSDDHQLYYEAVVERGGKELVVAAAKSPEMGMTAAAVLTMKLIAHYRPQYLIMPGIAAGLTKYEGVEEIYGDVVVASSVWNYSLGKCVSRDADIYIGNVGYILRPSVIDTDTKLVEILQKAAVSKEHESYVRVSPMVSVSKVIANSDVKNHIMHTNINAKGLDMEAYGVAYAVKEAIEPRPQAIIAKSVCDFADGRKNDRFQAFAALTSCQFVKYLIEKALPER